jgi:hypothetical protein
VRETLPVYLLRPQAEIDADKAAMKLRAASFTRARLTPEERDIARGAQLEEIARANLELQEALRAEGHNVSTRGGANLEMVALEEARLAEGLELQGRYFEAAAVYGASVAHPHKLEQERLRKIEEAVEKPDGEFCGCPPDEADVPGKVGHPHYEVKKIYSRRHGRAVALVACRKCGELNATPAPPAALARTLSAVAGSHGAATAQGLERLRRGTRR